MRISDWSSDVCSSDLHLFTDGELRVAGSATVADREEGDGTIAENRFRGHIDAEGRFDLDDTWRWGFEANRTTDDTYLRAYDFDDSRTQIGNASCRERVFQHV